jgi:RimJ/RimL family protein N-acetyltransferase
VIETDRLVLRPFTLEDAPALAPIIGQREVASQLPSIPHPLPPGGAEEWIRDASRSVTFAVVRRADDVLMGAISLHVQPDGERAQLGGFLGKEYWHEGYAPEATRALIRYGRRQLGMKRIFWIREEKSFDLDTGEEQLGWPSITRAEPTAPYAPGAPSLRSRIASRFRR